MKKAMRLDIIEEGKHASNFGNMSSDKWSLVLGY